MSQEPAAWHTGWTRAEALAPPLLLVAVLAAQWPALNPAQLAPQLPRLGMEYGNIATSLLAGSGFSNPFGYQSGPTAWMPPGVVAVYAIVFAMFGVRTYAAACALMVLKAVLLTATLPILSMAARAWKLCSQGSLQTLAILAILGRWDWLGALDLDESLVIFLSALLLWALAEHRRASRRWQYVVVGAMPLFSPSLALVAAVLVMGRAIRSRGAWWLLLPMALAAGSWTVRNEVVLGRAIPLKSNLWCELYLSNTVSPSGLLSTETLLREHPVHPWNSRQMQSEGETRTMDGFRHRTLRWLRENPEDFVRKVGARAFSAFVRGYTTDYFHPVGLPVEAEDARVLQQAHLLWVARRSPLTQFWLYSDLSPEQAQEELRNLPLKDPETAISSWSRQREERRQRDSAPSHLARAFIYSLLPTLALLRALLSGRGRRAEFREAAAAYLVFLLPYVLISYMQRYQVAALGLQIWMVWLALLAPQPEAGAE